MKKKTDYERCCICGCIIENDIRDGHNPDPLLDEEGKPLCLDGVCCASCNRDYVIPARLSSDFSEIQKVVLQERAFVRLRKKTCLD